MRETHDAQDACHRAPARCQDRADQQNLRVPPGALDEEWRKRQDDPGKAGGKERNGSVSWQRRH